MANWPVVQITVPSTNVTIGLQQIDSTTIGCTIINEDGNSLYVLTNCTASADCLTLAAQTKWFLFVFNVSIVLTSSTVTISYGDNPLIYPISLDDSTSAKGFILNCHLPLISENFKLGRVAPSKVVSTNRMGQNTSVDDLTNPILVALETRLRDAQTSLTLAQSNVAMAKVILQQARLVDSQGKK